MDDHLTSNYINNPFKGIGKLYEEVAAEEHKQKASERWLKLKSGSKSQQMINKQTANISRKITERRARRRAEIKARKEEELSRQELDKPFELGGAL